MKILRHIRLTSRDTDLTALYRRLDPAYPKFFKMDTLCKAGFLATELLLSEDKDRFLPREDRAVLLFSKSGSLCNDTHYRDSIREENYFPSPSLFVYTLANIITGEIAIRNHYKGDTSAFILNGFDAAAIAENVTACFEDPVTQDAICGWAECTADNDFDVLLMLAAREGEGLEFNETSINQLYGRTHQ